MLYEMSFPRRVGDAIVELIEEVERLEKELEEAQLARIEAQNPGIDIDKVREARAR